MQQQVRLLDYSKGLDPNEAILAPLVGDTPEELQLLEWGETTSIPHTQGMR